MPSWLKVHTVSCWCTFKLSVIGLQIQSVIYCTWWTTGEQIKDLCELWWLGKDKASLLDCGAEAYFIPFECRVANRMAVHCTVYSWYCNGEHLPKKYLLFKICGRNINYPHSVGMQWLNLNFTNTKFLLLSYEIVSWNSEMHDSLHLKTVNVYKWNYGVSIKTYWKLTICGDLRLSFQVLMAVVVHVMAVDTK
jgi:hypothetical protein